MGKRLLGEWFSGLSAGGAHRLCVKAIGESVVKGPCEFPRTSWGLPSRICLLDWPAYPREPLLSGTSILGLTNCAGDGKLRRMEEADQAVRGWKLPTGSASE